MIKKKEFRFSYFQRKKTIVFFVGFLLTLFVLPLLSAVQINNTLLQTSSSNLTINVTQNAFLDSYYIYATSMIFYGYNDDNSEEKVTFTLVEEDKSYFGSDLPYFSQTSVYSKTITSNLTEIPKNILVRISNHTEYGKDCRNILNLKVTSSDSAQETLTYTGLTAITVCKQLTSVGYPLPLAQGDTTIFINFVDTSQSGIFAIDFTKPINMIIFILLILVIIILMIYRQFMFAAGLTIIAGFLLLASGINLLVSGIVIIIGVLIAFLSNVK